LDSIALAYKKYYTHEESLDDDPLASGTSLESRAKQFVLRSYIDAYYGAKPSFTSKLVASVMRLRPKLRLSFDASMRHLPRPRVRATLLDIGCGSGRFMAWARAAGWICSGVEVDEVSAAKARQRGFEVHVGDLQELVAAGRKFDAVTISHVIEHVHDAPRLLALARRLLAANGHFWIETPNVDALGHRCFGVHWRDLDPPRHLQLFHSTLLRRLLQEAGFTLVRQGEWQNDWQATAPTSARLAQEAGCSPVDLELPRDPSGIGRDDPMQREFVTLTATVSTDV
jgi:2-polyprenyl-3-methyl-5-hydroxy-6-metoxy-1,4-benzoquinol methylase